MRQDPDANFGFLNGLRNADPEDSLFTGIRSDFVPDEIQQKTLPSIVVGGMRQGKPQKGAKVLPTLITDRPVFNKANKVVRGSVIDQSIDGGKARKVIVSHKEGNTWYVLVRTGLRVGPQGTMGDYLDLSASGDLKSHGSFNFDRNTGAVKLAESREENALFGSAEAQKLWEAKGRKIPGTSFLDIDYTLWGVPEGAVVIVRDINGKMTRLIGGKTRLFIEDANGYDKFFDRLLEEAVEARKRAS